MDRLLVHVTTGLYVVLSCPSLVRRWAVLEHRSARLVVNTQVKACFRETRSFSRACKIYGHKAFQITHLHATAINSGRAALLNIAHTVEFAMELASALTVAIILADAAVTPTVSEMTYNMSSWTLNHTQPNHWRVIAFKLLILTLLCDLDL